MGYFAGRDPAQPAVAYRVVRAGLVDTASSRRALVELFKPALLGTGARLDFSRWLALPEGGYCFATSAATPAMAMDFRTEEGTITGVVVGPVSDCATAQPDLELEQRFRDRRRAGTDAGC